MISIGKTKIKAGMKNIHYIIAAALVLAGCSKSFVEVGDDYVRRTYVAELGAATKTSIETGGKISWNEGDTVRYYSKKSGTVGECAVAASGAHAELTLDVATSASFLVAVYGGTGLSGNLGSSVTIEGAVPAVQSGAFGDSHVAIAKTYDVTSSKLTFTSLVSYFKFTLTRDDVKKVVFKSNDGTVLDGNGGMNVTFATDSEEISAVQFASQGGSDITVGGGGAGTFYIATIPCTLSQGFTMDCYGEDGTYLGSAVSRKSVTLGEGAILNLGTLDTRIEKQYTDLSADGTANCYIVSKKGNYKFSATVKGGSTEAVDGNPYRAEVLWESFGTGTAPSVGDLVSGVSYADGYITFTASSLKGNAVIAAKDASGTILWSWHIWMTDTPVDQVYNNEAGTMMDRNLGATSATPGDVHALGLLYQWGRKDPFLGSSSISSSANIAKSTYKWPSAVKVSEIANSDNSLAYAVANPTTYIYGGNDWYCTDSSNSNDGLWSASKSAYDPCPVGYRVPDGGPSGIWSTAFANDGTSVWYDTSKCKKYSFTASGECWYPAAGQYYATYGSLRSVGGYGHYWSCTPDNNKVYCLYFYNYGSDKSYSEYRANGNSVRCARE